MTSKRWSLSRAATSIVLSLLVAACTSATSPAPATPSPPASPTPTPTPPPTDSPPAASPAIGSIATGYQFTCALTSEGGVKCWGSNDSGQLGNGTTTDSSVPVDVSGLATGVSAIAAGGAHACALTSEGGVKCWGSNGAGQLGNGSTADSGVPVDVAGLVGDVSAVAAGGAHTCALESRGAIQCWGANAYAQLGDGTMTDSSIPVAVSGLAREASAIAAGDIHSCALTSGGGVKCWGYAGSGGLGGAVPGDVPRLASGVGAISAGYEQSCAVTTDGTVLCWSGYEGGSPIDVFYYFDVAFSAISAGLGQSCGLTTNGAVKCWHGFDSSLPADVPGLASGVTAISVGGGHACAITTGGAVMCWGDNWEGQLGNGRTCATLSGSTVAVEVDVAAPSAAPKGPPIGRIEHPTGPTDVVLRFDRGPDFSVGDLVGELFRPGPEFTLFGDGTVIFRSELLPPAEGPVLRARPFMSAHLDEDQVQSLLRFALGEGGLWDACERYETQASDPAGSDVFTIRAGGLDKRVEDLGSGPFGTLTDYLRNFDRSGIPTRVFTPDRYWGNLLDASVFKGIGDGQAPGLAEAGTVPWPWPGVVPAEFIGLADFNSGRRVMSVGEAAVLGLSDNGGVVQRVYLLGPDGETIYYFSLWPILPAESS